VREQRRVPNATTWRERGESGRVSITSWIARIPAEGMAIRVNHCQIAAARRAARAQCAKALACRPVWGRGDANTGNTGPPGKSATQDRGRASIGRAAVTGRRSDGRGAV